MNYIDELDRARGRLSTIDTLLMGVAVRVQLPPSLFTLAQDRFDTIAAYLRRAGSPIAPYVRDVYVQGSFSIGATIRQAKRSRSDDGFDIDGMVQIVLPPGISRAFDVIGLLFQAINGPPGSRYHGKVRRRSRCVTIDYEEMHFDLTPIVELDGALPRTGVIFEAKPDGPRTADRTLRANPWGFADWYNARVGGAGIFGQIFEGASIAYDIRRRKVLNETAGVVPDQIPAYRKPRATIALQLFKRWRTVTWDRENIARRMPPSVLCAWFAASNTGRFGSLHEELHGLAAFVIFNLTVVGREGKLLDVPNPRCQEDDLTDRWPADAADQARFVDHLRRFAADIAALENTSLADQLAILSRLFGEGPAGDVIEQVREDQDAVNAIAGPLTRPGRASIPVGLGAATVAPGGVRAAPRHTNFGGVE